MLFDDIVPYIPEPNVIENRQDWLDTRKTKITGSDMPLIMEYLTAGKQSYYNKSISTLTKDKLYSPEPSKFQKEIFARGHLEEALLVSRAVHDFGKENVWNNRYYIRDNVFMCTVDIELRLSDNSYKVFEVKTTGSKLSLEMYKDGTHPAYWQVYMQLYCLEGLTDTINIIVKPVGALSNAKSLYTSVCINDEKYKTFIKNIEVFKQIHEKIINSQEYFIKSDVKVQDSKKEPLYDDVLSLSVDKYISICEDISQLEIQKNALKDSILNSTRYDGQPSVKSNGLCYISISDRNRKVIKSEYKDELASIKLKNSKLLDTEIFNMFGNDAYNTIKCTSITIQRGIKKQK